MDRLIITQKNFPVMSANFSEEKTCDDNHAGKYRNLTIVLLRKIEALCHKCGEDPYRVTLIRSLTASLITRNCPLRGLEEERLFLPGVVCSKIHRSGIELSGTVTWNAGSMKNEVATMDQDSGKNDNARLSGHVVQWIGQTEKIPMHPDDFNALHAWNTAKRFHETGVEKAFRRDRFTLIKMPEFS